MNRPQEKKKKETQVQAGQTTPPKHPKAQTSGSRERALAAAAKKASYRSSPAVVLDDGLALDPPS